jgi:hypothetical protein
MDHTDHLLSILVILMGFWMINQTWHPPGLPWDLAVLIVGVSAIIYPVISVVFTL